MLGVRAKDMKGIGIVALLIAFATAEIISAGALYSVFGLFNLLIIYVVTTGLGSVVLASQMKSFKAVTQGLENKNENVKANLEAQLEGAEPSHEAKRWAFLVFQATIYTFSWVLVLIPGLVTDFLGYGLIGVWFTRKGRASAML